jgi:hypothetical protein
VFSCRADRCAAFGSENTVYSEVVCFGSAAGEHHFRRIGSDKCGDCVSGFIYGSAGFSCLMMGARRVAWVLGKPRHHCFNYFWSSWGARSVI